MKNYSLTHLADESVALGLDKCDTTDRTNLAELLAHVAEYCERQLYLPRGFSSMFDYCVNARGWSEDVACKRIRVGQKAREFPAIFDFVAEGRIHFTGLVMLAPHLTAENVAELLAAAAGKTKFQIECLIAERFPKSDLPSRMRVIEAPASITTPQPLALGAANARPEGIENVVSVNNSSAPGRINPIEPRPKMIPLAPQRYGYQFTVGQSAQDKFREAQELLSHQISPKDYEKLFERLLDIALPELRKRKFGATPKPRGPRVHAPANARHVPAHIKRAVWGRDGGQCTFVSDNGHRCSARKRLEYDHVQEVARGGTSCASNIRLRCRAHNQYSAERTFGIGFMNQKRDDARRPASGARESDARACQSARFAAAALAQVTATVERAAGGNAAPG